jgi:hypothetical protein
MLGARFTLSQLSLPRQYDSDLAAYYEKKRNEGKSFTVATVATTRKLCCRIYAVLEFMLILLQVCYIDDDVTNKEDFVNSCWGDSNFCSWNSSFV